ncbi:MAG: hypothetical protein AAF799_04815 [Myxococcota bacterium]
MGHSTRACAWLLGTTLVLVAGSARATDGVEPRIPPDWTDPACIQIVDRSAGSSTINLPYSILEEDLDIPNEEVEDSRRHQFFAFCRSYPLTRYLPTWITQADIDRADLVGLGPTGVEVGDLLEEDPAWDDCWFRITEDDDRRPISFDVAAAGVDWDTSQVPAGTYLVEGYTWFPPFNEWNDRAGVIKVVDEPDLAASGPAIAISNGEEIVFLDETVTIEGCVSAMEGSTIDAYYALNELPEQWVAFAEDEPVDTESFAIELAPPEELFGESLMVRVEITDPMGRSFVHHMREFVVLLESSGPGSCDEGGFIGGAGCQGTDDGSSEGPADTDGMAADSTAGTTASSATESDSSTPQTGPGSGCGCNQSPGRAPGTLALGLWALLGRRRRRR